MIGWRLAPGVTRLSAGRLAGGSPFRVLRLSDSGQRQLTELLGTATQPAAGSALARLTDRMVASGLLLAPPRSAVVPHDVTVVVPARTTSPEIVALLQHIPADIPVVVVDDGSAPAVDLGPADRPNVTLIRRELASGPAAARNLGARSATTSWIAFVDADITPGEGWLGALLAHTSAPDVLAVAPRVVSAPAAGWVGLVELWSGALDLGATPADVGPGRPVPFVPTAVLLVDREALTAVGGFDESLIVGEDVDLVWRLTQRGRVRYEPDAVCQHRARPSLRAVLRRRFDYGTSAAPLERRHRGQLRHADVSIWSFAPWLLGIVVHPLLGAVAAGATVAIAPRGLTELPAGDARRLAARGHLLATAGLGRYLARPMWPLTMLALVAVPRRRKVILGALGIGMADHVRRWVTIDHADGLPGLDPASGLAVGKVMLSCLLDDAAYSLGVWAGCWRERTWAPLLPRVRDLQLRRRGRPR